MQTQLVYQRPRPECSFVANTLRPCFQNYVMVVTTAHERLDPVSTYIATDEDFIANVSLAAPINEDDLAFAFFAKHRALSMLSSKQKRGIVEECCIKPCSRHELSTYCAWVSWNQIIAYAKCLHIWFLQYQVSTLTSVRVQTLKMPSSPQPLLYTCK